MKLMIDGKKYGYPNMETLTYDEIDLFERFTDMTLQEAATAWQRGKLSLQRGLQFLALVRGNPKKEPAELWEKLGKLAPSQIKEIEEPEDKEAAADPDPRLPLDQDSPATPDESKSGKNATSTEESPGTAPAPSGRRPSKPTLVA